MVDETVEFFEKRTDLLAELPVWPGLIAFIVIGYGGVTFSNWFFVGLGWLFLVLLWGSRNPIERRIETLFKKRCEQMALKPMAEMSSYNLGLHFGLCQKTGRVLMLSLLKCGKVHECFIGAQSICNLELEIDFVQWINVIDGKSNHLRLVSEESPAFDDQFWMGGFGKRRTLITILEEDYGWPTFRAIAISIEGTEDCSPEFGGLIYVSGQDHKTIKARLAIAEQWCLALDRLCNEFEVVEDGWGGL